MHEHHDIRPLRRRIARIAGLGWLGSGLLLAGGCALDQREPDVAEGQAEAPFGAAPLAPLAPVTQVGASTDGGGARASEGSFVSERAADSAGSAPQLPRLLSLGQPCTASSDACEAALRCVSGSCRVPCVSAADCSSLGPAVDCTVGAALDGSGVGACDYQTYCDPAHPQNPTGGAAACAAGSGCRPSESGESACQPQPGGGTAGSTCTSDADCTVDRFCGENGTCLRYCLTNADCGSDVCSPFAVPLRAGNLAVGFCATPDCDPVHPQSPRDGLSACPAGQGCRSTSEAGRTGCEPRSGAGKRYDRCTTTDECQPGLFCGANDLRGACHQYCFSDADCPGERCRHFSGDGRFAGPHELGVCAAVCNPANPGSSEGGFGVCPAGFGCSPSEDQGLSVCTLAGTQQPYERCTSALDCGAGYACGEGAFAHCSRYCLSTADCGPGSSCVPVSIAAGTSNVGRCVENCDPINPQSSTPPFSACPAGFGCSLMPTGEGICHLAGSGRQGAGCADHDDCAPGFACSAEVGCTQICLEDRDCGVGRCTGALVPAQRPDLSLGLCIR